VGCIIFPQMAQINFTAPFEVLLRMPDTAMRIVGKQLAPIRDVRGLHFTPDMTIAQSGS
jgi:cyclohexyl-isocyanide hydratase